MKKKLLAILFALGIVGIFLSSSNFSMGAVLPQTVGVFETSLASPISTSATSMTLTANAVRGGTTLSGYTCFTVDQGSAQAEFICGTVSGTSVTALVRGIDPATGTSTVSALQFAHRRGASVKITDFPAIVIMRHQLNGSDSVYNLMRYDTNVLIGVGSPTSTLATKYYVDNTASAGAATADETTKGLVELATAREAASSTALGGSGGPVVLRGAYATDTPQSGCAVGFTSTPGAGCVPVARLDGKISANFIATSSAYNWGGVQTYTASNAHQATETFNGVTFGANVYAQYRASTTITAATSPVPVFVATSTNALQISEADVATTTDFLGFATSSNLTNGATGTVQISGIVNGFSGLTAGLSYYVQDTRGTIGTSPGTAELYVGRAVSATQILLDRQDDNMRFLGSATCTLPSQAANSPAGVQCDTSSFPFARYAEVMVTNSATVCASGPRAGVLTGQIRTYKIGLSSPGVTLAYSCTDIAGSAVGLGGNFTVAFTSSSSVRVSYSNSGATSGNNGGGTQTAYFWK